MQTDIKPNHDQLRISHEVEAFSYEECHRFFKRLADELERETIPSFRLNGRDFFKLKVIVDAKAVRLQKGIQPDNAEQIANYHAAQAAAHCYGAVCELGLDGHIREYFLAHADIRRLRALLEP